MTSELSSKQKKGSARKTMLKGFSALLLTCAASSAFAGTCIQQDALGSNSVAVGRQYFSPQVNAALEGATPKN